MLVKKHSGKTEIQIWNCQNEIRCSTFPFFIYSKDHIRYELHKCQSSYKKDIQVPVCPLCNQPVPWKRGEAPDIAVGDHIDRDCQSDPAKQKRKVVTNLNLLWFKTRKIIIYQIKGLWESMHHERLQKERSGSSSMWSVQNEFLFKTQTCSRS